MQVEELIRKAGIQPVSIRPVSGGDINQAFCADDGQRRYFLKINSNASFPFMFAREANGLRALSESYSGMVPRVIAQGTFEEHQYLVLEWIEKASPGPKSWNEAGEALARMHKKPGENFGWEEDNYIGSLVQKNEKRDTWTEFYTEMRILPLVKILADRREFSAGDVKATEKFCTKLNEIFPKESPALLHGDLWSGNFMFGPGGRPCIYDPAVYYGHREMDLGMTLLFGGFPPVFYEAYQQIYPPEKNWRERVPITQLYPLLVHAVLFGGGYVSSALSVIKKA